MEPFKIHILGCGSALPTMRHYASSQVVEIRGKLFMVDCGEGTQMQLRRSKIRFTKIQAVFISHLHGDHCFGLMGLISTFGMLVRNIVNSSGSSLIGYVPTSVSLDAPPSSAANTDADGITIAAAQSIAAAFVNFLI